jgi:hypothetical protein
MCSAQYATTCDSVPQKAIFAIPGLGVLTPSKARFERIPTPFHAAFPPSQSRGDSRGVLPGWKHLSRHLHYGIRQRIGRKGSEVRGGATDETRTRPYSPSCLMNLCLTV